MLRALLIGSPYGGLDVEPSVAGVYTWLLGHGFQEGEIERLVGPRATRFEILDGLRRLADGDPDDAPIVFYYAGHGHLYRTEHGADEPGAHEAHPLLVAIDIDESADGVLRSVFGSELSRALQRVARRARNLTVILDCCHASGMVRLDDQLDDPEIAEQEIRLHGGACERIRARRAAVTRGFDLECVAPRLSEQVVVLAASSAGGRAYPDPSTGRMVFTDALLAAIDRHPTWDAVLAEVRATVQEVWPIQHPAVFGPRLRRPLSLDQELPDVEQFHVELRGAQLVLIAGALAGIDHGDQFELTTTTTTGLPSPIVGIAQPQEIRPDHTLLGVAWLEDPLPQPCYARRVERGRPHAVALADPRLRRELAGLVEGAGLRIADDPRDVAAHIELRDGLLRVSDCLGALVLLAPDDPRSHDALLRCLKRLDRWRSLSTWLRADSSRQPLRGCYGLRWGRAGDARAPTSGEVVVRPGDALALALHNLDRGAPELYAQAFRIRADRDVRAWNPETGAHSIVARQRADAGQARPQGRRAHLLAALPGLPPGTYREWTVVVVSDHAFADDLLETPLDARALASGLADPERSSRGDDDRRFDVVAFPYTLELAHLASG